MDEIVLTLKGLANVAIFAFFTLLFQKMFYAIKDMRKLAKKSWQGALTELLAALLGFIGVGAVIVLITGV